MPQLYSLGYCYRRDHTNKTSVNWRCKIPKCPGRCKSGIDGPPVDITSPHNHSPDIAQLEVLNQRKKLKEVAESDNRNSNRRFIRDSNSHLSDQALALIPSYNADRQFMNRVRNSQEVFSNYNNRLEIQIPHEYYFTRR